MTTGGNLRYHSSVLSMNVCLRSYVTKKHPIKTLEKSNCCFITRSFYSQNCPGNVVNRKNRKAFQI